MAGQRFSEEERAQFGMAEPPAGSDAGREGGADGPPVPSAGLAGLVVLGVWLVYVALLNFLTYGYASKGQEIPRYFVFLGILEWCLVLAAGILTIAGVARDRNRVYAAIGLPLTGALVLAKIVLTAVVMSR